MQFTGGSLDTIECSLGMTQILGRTGKNCGKKELAQQTFFLDKTKPQHVDKEEPKSGVLGYSQRPRDLLGLKGNLQISFRSCFCSFCLFLKMTVSSTTSAQKPHISCCSVSDFESDKTYI